MGNTAAAAVETEAPAPTVTTIGNSEVTITAAGEATVKPLARATEPVIPTPVVVAESTEIAPPVNRFAVAMTAATQRAEEVAAKAAADCTCCGGGKCVGCDTCTCEGVGKDCACCMADSCTGCKTCTHESMTAAEKPPADGIANEADLMSAIKKSASADDPGAEKTKIKKAAKRLGLVDKLPRTWRAVKPELLRHMVGGDPADDLSCAIGCLRSVGWISRDVEYLLASEMAEGLGGGPTEGGQVVILQGVLASLQAACAGLKEFIADEASEGAAGGAPEPAPPAAVETADEAMMEAAAKPRMIRGLAALNRRLASLEAIAKTPASVPAFTSADAEQLATAMGQVFGSTTAPLSRALGDLGNEVKAVREELDQVLKLPKPYGVARGVQQQRNVGQGALTGDVQPAAKLAVLRDLASRTNNPVSLGEIQVEINRAEALLKGNPG